MQFTTWETNVTSGSRHPFPCGVPHPKSLERAGNCYAYLCFWDCDQPSLQSAPQVGAPTQPPPTQTPQSTAGYGHTAQSGTQRSQSATCGHPIWQESDGHYYVPFSKLLSVSSHTIRVEHLAVVPKNQYLVSLQECGFQRKRFLPTLTKPHWHRWETWDPWGR